MSNEMKNWLHDRKAETEYWISKYPFLRIKHWTNTEEDEGCWFDCMPEGWVRAFGKQMCDDLMEALGDYAYEWTIVEIKEKYGELRIYDAGCPAEIYDKVQRVLSKYTYISGFVCIKCGSLDARIYDSGWAFPYCEECFTRHMRLLGEDVQAEKFAVGNKFTPTYTVRQFSNAGITEVTVDVSNEWERMKNVE